MVMKASPASAFVVAQPQFLLEVLIVSLDAPAQLGHFDQLSDGGVCWQCGEPVLGRLRIAFGPLDQQPFVGPRFGSLEVPGGRKRTAAKRDVRSVLVPSRHLTLIQASGGSACARALAEIGR